MEGVAVARIDGGGIRDVVQGPEGRATEVRFERCPSGWQATFELTQPGLDDLAIVHRLVAPTLREARLAVPQAISFLLGNPLEGSR